MFESHLYSASCFSKAASHPPSNPVSIAPLLCAALQHPRVPFSRPAPLLSFHHLYVWTYTLVYSCHKILCTSSISRTAFFILPSPRASQITKLLHSISVLFYSSHNVFCSLSACKVAITHLSAALQLQPTYIHILPVSFRDAYHT